MFFNSWVYTYRLHSPTYNKCKFIYLQLGLPCYAPHRPSHANLHFDAAAPFNKPTDDEESMDVV